MLDRMGTSIMHSNQSEKKQYPAFFRFKRLIPALVVLVAVTSSIFVFSKTANAGLVSFLNMLMGNQQASAKLMMPRAADSQILSTIVLTAASNPILVAQASQVPPIVGETTLSPDIARMNATSTEEINTQISIYVVRPGDTISSVAKMFSVSVSTVLWANDLTSRSLLQPGQTLVILPVTGITHKVKSGDTIQSIAKKYDADIEDILNYNDRTLASVLKAGEEILIPNAEIPATAAAPVRSIAKPAGGPLIPGYYSCPVPGAKVTQRLHGHNGVDLGAPQGTPIRAAAGGTVIINRSNGAWNGGYGNFIVILHSNGTQSLYSHMSRSVVQAGEIVSKNQTIGYVGMTGLTTGPHLHLEVRGAQNPFTDQNLCR